MGALMATSAMPVAAADPSAFTVGDQAITVKNVIHGNKSASGRIAQSDEDLVARNDGALVNVLIKLDVDGAASYDGGVNGLRATSPSATGKSLKDNAAAVATYKAYLSGVFTSVSRAINTQVPAAQLGKTFTIAFGGIAARVPANQARNLLKVQGVAAVMYDTIEKPLTDATPHFIGADAVWPSLGGPTAGEGVKVGVLDTGIWPEHPSFTDPGISHPGGTYGCEFGLSGDPNDPAFACNDKLIGAYAFLDTNLMFTGPGAPGEFCPTLATCSARDADGHGTHTSSTAAGRQLSSAVLFGVERGPLSGIAPGAHVIMYRVCDDDGCFSSDSMNAVEQAITDDVDVINFSISGGADPYSDGVELAFLDAYAAGILVNASAGNSGPGAATVAHGGPWVNTVGASTSDRHFISTLHLTGDGGAALDIQGVTITAGVTSPTPVVLSSDAPYSNVLCDAPAAPGTFTGKVVVCKRGVVGRAEKGYNVAQGGAAGMILYNASAASTDLESDNHWLPAIHVQYNGGNVPTFVTGHTNVMAWWTTGVATHVTGDVMASFSSRGPLSDFIKPDVTAPGVQILAGHSPKHIDVAGGPNGELFQAIAGTSMSSPHAAGVAALLKDAHPGWTPGEIKSAMMTQSVQDVLKEDGVTPADPFDRGAGSIRADRANKAPVTFRATSADFYASVDNEFGRINLNLPSVNAPNMPGKITTWRTARNNSPYTQTFDITATGPTGAKITINPTTLTINAWQEKSFFIDIDGTKLTDGQYFGQITINPRATGAANAVLPVAFNKHPGEVTLNNSCASATVAVGSEIACDVTVQNLADEVANVSLRVKGPRSRNLLLNDWSAGNKKGNGFVWNGQLSASLAPPIVSLTPGHGPAGGYLPLTAFGIPGEGFYGDEDLANYGVPTFSYGHELYSTIGVTSNGYVVVGGGGSQDLNYIPQDFPDAAPPNNVLAPYWTDLNAGSAGDIYLGILTDGTDTWIVIDWEGVPVYPGPANPRSFQIWLQIGGTADEGIWFEHAADAVGAAGSSDGLIVGAENRDGSSGADLGWNVPPANTGYQVITGNPTPGGSMTITYDAKGVHKGTYKILSTMVTDITQGTATDLDKIKVTP
ncbi:MAG: S8 family serine peptidase [Candidatus Limnocylindrales bacterium]